MKTDQVRRDTILGAVFFGALGLLLYFTFVFGSGGNRPDKYYEVAFEDAQGIKKGDQVMVLGMRAGLVDGIDVLDTPQGGRVRVRFFLSQPIVLREDARVAIQDSSLLGGKQLTVDPGKGAPRAGTGLLRGVDQRNFMQGLNDALGSADTAGDMKAFIHGLRVAIDKLNTGEGTAGLLLNDRRLYDNLTGLIVDARDGRGSLGKLLTDPALFDRATGFFQNAENLAAQIDRALADRRGLLGKIVGDEKLAEDMARFADNLRELTDRLRDGKGLLGRLTADEKMADDLANALKGFSDLMVSASQGEGLVAQLLHNKDMAANFVAVSNDLRKFTDALVNGRGTLGRLAMDDTIARSLERMIMQFTRTLEDAREAAPIGTFFQVFGGAFY